MESSTPSLAIPRVMRAMVLEATRTPLVPRDLPVPALVACQALVKVHACAVCRTDLHIVDGELPWRKHPLIPGHQIAGAVVATGDAERIGLYGFGAAAYIICQVALIWGERAIRSVANLTRRDGEEFLTLAPRIPVHTEVQIYPLASANEALADPRGGRVRGAAVLAVEMNHPVVS